MSIHPAIGPGKTAVITGAADGIGLAAAQAFAGLGMNVVMADIMGRALKKAADAIGDKALAVRPTSPTAPPSRPCATPPSRSSAPSTC
jgi:NAD(P)-dependent dehydrogenase (short-subunit alcohol dehydrogenase family)